ncbi:MAG: hypothetical protein E7254_09750 [Lachnospiraceae bacterium]|nr:hypothetical protein [Lachnospiraceae bacterium]
MGKRFLIYFFALVIVLSGIIHQPVAGDIGPKPSVNVEIKGLEGEEYWVTLLAEEIGRGPHDADNVEEERIYLDEDGKKVFDIIMELCKDEDFYFWGIIQNCTEDNLFVWSYYPPKNFKILIFLPKLNKYYISDKVYSQYALDSYFKVKIDDIASSNINKIPEDNIETVEDEIVETEVVEEDTVETETVEADTIESDTVERIEIEKGNVEKVIINDKAVEKEYDYPKEIRNLLIRMMATIIVEILLALLMGFRNKRELAIIFVTNVATQIFLNIALNIMNFPTNYNFEGYMALEGIVVLIEGFVYIKTIGKERGKKSYIPIGIYAVIANAITLYAGFVLAEIVPKYF